jgi:methyl-accepting chemotaxis protein
MTDPQFTVAEANTAYLQMSGMDKKSVIGMSLRSVKVLEQKGEGAKVAIQGKKRSFGEVTVELPSGIHTLEQFTIPLLDAGGGIANLLFVYNDVTSQRRHQQELTEKMAQIATLKQRSDIIVRQNPMPILLLDPAFKIILVNDAYIALTGIKKETLLAMNARDFAIMEQKGEGLKKVITDRKRSFGEVRLQFPSGIKVLEQYGIPIVDAEGKLSTILAVYNDVTRQREQEAEIKRMMEEAKAEAELLSMSVSELRTAMASVASGDMTYLLSIDEADPLAPIKNDYNMAMGAIRTVMEEIVQSVIKIHSTVKETLQSNEEIAKATEQVAVSSQKSTDEAKSQLSSMERIAKDISEISASIEEIASTSQEVTGHARKASQMGADAAKIGTVATEKMQIFERISQESLDNITALNDQMRQISKIVNLITDIANQTNLLALNAAIEAARAAEHGRGFAVVAGEVKNLAAESKRASAQIEDLIKGIQAKSAVTAESMSNSFTEIKAGIESVNSTVAALSQIIAEANVVSAGITEITRATGDQAKAANQLMQGIESSAGLTRGNRKRMEDLAALAQETSASTEEIASASSELVRMADRTKDLMQKFRLN